LIERHVRKDDPMLRAMIDTMVFDRVVDDPEAFEAMSQAVRERRLALFTTPVQEAQVAAVSDPRRRKQLRTVPREVLPTSSDVAADGRRHVADAMIAETALARCDLLVTEDRRLTERSLAQGLEVWNVDRLFAWVNQASNRPV
jgi:predicted nucleic acid-binding protein